MTKASDEDLARPTGSPDDDEPVLSVRGLTVSFASEAGTVHAVRGLDLDLHRGRTLGIVGESGSGKSVTSLAIMGLLDSNAHVEGSIRWHGCELLGMSDVDMSAIRGRGISMVFQDPLSALTPVFSIGDQIREALVVHNPDMTARQVHDRSVELLDLVGIPDPERRLKSYPFQFSGGMRQRVMIAMAIANDPDVIIADEPTTALDVTIQAQVLDVLRKVQRQTGAAVIFITHDLGVIAGIADDIIVMYAGRPVENAPVDDIFLHPAMPYTMGLLGSVPRPDRRRSGRLVPIPGSPVNLADLPKGCPFAERCPMAVDRCRQEEPPLRPVPGRAGQFTACHRTGEIVDRGLTFSDVFSVGKGEVSKFQGVPREKRAVVLDVKGLVKTFPLTTGGFLRRRIGEVHAVDGVDLEIREGETLALVGESGSGKSTTLGEIMGLRPPQAGSISIFGTTVDRSLSRRRRRELAGLVQYIFQDPMSSLDPRLPIYDILAEPLRVQHLDRTRIRNRIEELMHLVDLNPDQVDRFPIQFSGGQRQRIAIARALAVDPRLLLLDEPVSALDVSIQAGILNLLEDLQNRLGIAYLVVAHNMSVVRHMAQRIAVMYLGRIVESGSADEVFLHPMHPYTRALLSAVPVPDPRIERTRSHVVLQGELPSPSETFTGCPFAGRCPLFAALGPENRRRCLQERPGLAVAGDAAGHDHRVACHFASVGDGVS
ncbi:ABC transporter ATP-binding protein [uncultured Bifidobacterium sp.]|uniref:ABC transporter ATP-binding protein n=1 Tax=uncultured Bifidobacterium sp. TaxID=165187 RepID=UPI0028DC2EB6|nr:ABC transporter ATP-binding protein [uncultured Bifidobacterium sp.]